MLYKDPTLEIPHTLQPKENTESALSGIAKEETVVKTPQPTTPGLKTNDTPTSEPTTKNLNRTDAQTPQPTAPGTKTTDGKTPRPTSPVLNTAETPTPVHLGASTPRSLHERVSSRGSGGDVSIGQSPIPPIRRKPKVQWSTDNMNVDKEILGDKVDTMDNVEMPRPKSVTLPKPQPWFKLPEVGVVKSYSTSSITTNGLKGIKKKTPATHQWSLDESEIDVTNSILKRSRTPTRPSLGDIPKNSLTKNDLSPMRSPKIITPEGKHPTANLPPLPPRNPSLSPSSGSLQRREGKLSLVVIEFSRPASPAESEQHSLYRVRSASSAMPSLLAPPPSAVRQHWRSASAKVRRHGMSSEPQSSSLMFVSVVLVVCREL